MELDRAIAEVEKSRDHIRKLMDAGRLTAKMQEAMPDGRMRIEHQLESTEHSLEILKSISRRGPYSSEQLELIDRYEIRECGFTGARMGF